MKAIYEKRSVDFYYRSDKGGTVGVACAPHLHYHVEIVYMISGKMQAYIDSDAYEVSDGDMLIVFPNKIHRFVDEMRGNKYMLFIINPNLVPEFESIMASSTPSIPVIRNAASNKRLDSVARIVADCRNFPEEQKDTLMRAYLLSFFAEFMSMLSVNSGRNDDNQAMKAVVLYCSQNFTRDLSLSMLECELHLSKYYISHLFGDKLGIRFNDYINSLRISESCRLLRTTDQSITEIADTAGFGTIRTFNRAFVKQMGISPSDYRKSNKGRAGNISMPPEKVGVNGYITPEAQRHESESERELARLMNYPFLDRSDKADTRVEIGQRDAASPAYDSFTYPQQTRADDCCTYPQQAQADDCCTYPQQAQVDDCCTYPQQAQVDDCCTYPQQAQADDYCTYPQQAQADDCCTYPQRSDIDDCCGGSFSH